MEDEDRQKNEFGYYTNTRTPKQFITDYLKSQVIDNQSINVKKLCKNMENSSEMPAFTFETFTNHCNDLVRESELKQKESESKQGLFLIRPANDWINLAKNSPTPNRLYLDFWFENELCCLFASSNIGKSILAVQIGVDIAKNQTVLYFDMELSPKQIEGRYSENYQNHFMFPNEFLRVELDPNFIPENKSFEEILNQSLELSINTTGAKILIIDNLTYLRNDTEKAKDALSLMKYLKALKSKYSLSILVLAHTPKRDFTKPLSINDLAGSSMLGNFFDSAFTIGASAKDKSLRYLKQIKVRECEKKYDADNVIVHQIVKHTNFVQFEFLEYSAENEHLKEISQNDKSVMIENAKRLHGLGKSQRDISRELGIGLTSVNRYLKA